MTPEEIIVSPEEEILPVSAEEAQPAPVQAEAAEELSQLLSDPLPEEIPANAAEAAEVPQPAAEPEQLPEPEPAPAEKKAKKVRRKPHIALRIPLQLLSLVLAVALLATALAGALVLDLQQLTSAGGIKQLIDAVMTTITSSAPAKSPAEPTLNKLSNWTVRFDETDPSNPFEGGYTVIVDENGNTVVIDENGNVVDMDPSDIIGDENGDINIDLDELPEDILTGGDTEENMDSLIDWIFDQVEQSTGEELAIDKEQVQSFVEQSTVGDYLSEKLAGFAEDYINGTENTVITADEIMELLEENEALLQSELQVELTPGLKEELKQSVNQIVQETDINNTIREEVFGAVDEMLEESTSSLGVSMDEIRSALQLVTSESMRNFVILVNVVLILLLCLLNFYNVPAGLTWAAFPLMLAGGILQVPVILLQNIDLSAEAPGGIASLLASFANVFQPVHSGVLYLGVGLLVVSILWRIIRAIVRKVRAN